MGADRPQSTRAIINLTKTATKGSLEVRMAAARYLQSKQRGNNFRHPSGAARETPIQIARQLEEPNLIIMLPTDQHGRLQAVALPCALPAQGSQSRFCVDSESDSRLNSGAKIDTELTVQESTFWVDSMESESEELFDSGLDSGLILMTTRIEFTIGSVTVAVRFSFDSLSRIESDLLPELTAPERSGSRHRTSPAMKVRAMQQYVLLEVHEEVMASPSLGNPGISLISSIRRGGKNLIKVEAFHEAVHAEV
ncbi:hypothetical protein K438DRAFT_1778849 [Mycena galopus ATCC 62051]|nr:hypothetical protein K438DRAFT_1778849 [Mycena galopus ATCC 62051]